MSRPKFAAPLLVFLSVLTASLLLAETRRPPHVPGGARELFYQGPVDPAGIVRHPSSFDSGESLFQPISLPYTNPVFNVVPSYGSGGGDASGVAVGDMNEDGVPDLAVVNSTGSVGVLLGNGDGTFQPAMTYPTNGRGSDFVVLADVNGDGHFDLVATNFCASSCLGEGSVSVLLGNGDGTFQGALTFGTGGFYPNSVAVADLNKDGSPDLAVTNECTDVDCSNFAGSVAVLFGFGDGIFSDPRVHSSNGVAAYSVVIGDLDGDTSLDLVVANCCPSRHSSNGSVAVFPGTGKGTFLPPTNYDVGAGISNAVALRDVNGDSLPDLLVSKGCPVVCSVAVLFSNGDGTFQTALSFPTDGRYAPSLASEDLNGDGNPDLIVTEALNNNVAVLLGNGNGTFQSVVSYGTGGERPQSVAVADVNGDSLPDVLLANMCTSFWNCEGSVGVLLGNGNGTFQAESSYGLGATQPTFAAVVGDMNGDAQPDLAASNLDGTLSVLLGNADGTFQTAVSTPGVTSVGYSLALGDVNGDQKRDLVVTTGQGSVRVLLGNGDGSFQSPVSFGTGGATDYSVAVGDVNGDGNPDLAVSNVCLSCTNGTVGVLLGNGDGTFQAAVTHGSGGLNPLFVAIADVNADQKSDLLLANQLTSVSDSTGLIGVLLGNGDGTFQPATSYGTGGPNTDCVAVGDMNGDGKPDLIVVNQVVNQGGAVLVLLGNGDGTFQPPLTTSTPTFLSFPTSVALADFNGDGKLDVASGAGGGLLLGNGDGTLQSPIALKVHGSGTVAGDFNNDGKPDLAVAGLSVFILVNQATFPQATTTTLVSSANPSSFGQNVTFTATVAASGGGSPTGSVTFSDGATMLGTSPLSGGAATLQTSSLSIGSHSIVAVYGGDANFTGSSSTPFSQTVTKAATTVVLTPSENPAYINQAITFSAVVSPAFGGTPTGTVTFKNGPVTLGTVTLSGGHASIVKSFPVAGTKFITATYSGDATFTASTSPVLNEVIVRYPTATTVVSSVNPSVYGQSITFTATVSSLFGTPTGTVTFKNGGSSLGVGTLAGGVATLTTSTLGPGSKSITAVYAGNATFAPSTSSALIQTVNKATTTLTLTSSLNPSMFGQNVTFTAVVSPQFSGTPTGSVTFSDGTKKLRTVTLRAGTAAYSTSRLAVGAHSITATYSGNANFTTATGTLTQTVQ